MDRTVKLKMINTTLNYGFEYLGTEKGDMSVCRTMIGQFHPIMGPH